MPINKYMPVIKAEFKKNIWVLFAVLFSEYILCFGVLRSFYSNAALTFASECSFTNFGTDVLTWLMTCCALWPLLLIFVQFDRDEIQFKQALPFTNKGLIGCKFIIWCFIAAVAAVFFAAASHAALKNYDYLMTAGKYQQSFYSFIPDMAQLFACCLTALLFATAVYWYGALCCSVCRKAFHGIQLAVFGFITLCFFMSLTDNLSTTLSIEPIDFDAFAVSLGQRFPTADPTSAAVILITVVSSVAVNIVCIPLCLALYGRGTADDPIFYYKGASKVFNVLIVLFGICFVPVISDLYGKDVYLGMALGAVFGVVMIIIKNRMLKGAKTR